MRSVFLGYHIVVLTQRNCRCPHICICAHPSLMSTFKILSPHHILRLTKLLQASRSRRKHLFLLNKHRWKDWNKSRKMRTSVASAKLRSRWASFTIRNLTIKASWCINSIVKKSRCINRICTPASTKKNHV